MSLEIQSQVKTKQHGVLAVDLRHSLSVLMLDRQNFIRWIFEEIAKNPYLSLKKSTSKRCNSISWEDLEDTRKAQNLSLHDYILQQISLERLTQYERKCIEIIVQYLSENGFLSENLDWISEQHGLDKNDAQFALKKIQSCAPPGVGASHAQECLLLQLSRIPKYPEQVKKILKNHWIDFINQDFSKIAKHEHVSLDHIKSCVHFIRKYLDPHPARQFGEEIHSILKPDVYVFQRDQKWVCSLNQQGLPRVILSQKWENKFAGLDSQFELQAEAQEFFKNQIKSAKKTLNFISMRNQTILKVSEFIVSHQAEFFEKGISHLVKLTLKEVSEKLQLHESTISRSLSNKCLFSPRGLFEFKYFLSSGIPDDSGKQVSSKSIQYWIAQYIRQEDQKNPLSDETLIQLLSKEKNVSISRRTVAKYRKELNIPSTFKRKSKL